MTDQTSGANIGKYLILFTITYIIVSVAASVAMQFLELDRNIGLSIGILIGSAFFIVNKFVADNSRAPTKGEKHMLIGGSLVAVIAVSVLGLFVISLIEGVPFGEMLTVFTQIPLSYLAIGAAVILGVNWLVLNLVYGYGATKIIESRK